LIHLLSSAAGACMFVPQLKKASPKADRVSGRR
jgi:hypothetical protein